MSLQVQYRPKTFKTFVGNEAVVSALQKILQRDNTPSAFLFTGLGGSGKTTIGRIIRRELKCHLSDYKEINASADRGIDGIRKIIESMKFAPLSGSTKVILLDEAHMLLKPSQEALLKALEEPPEYVTFIVCTTNPEALKQTFKRRCHHFELEALKKADLMKLIRRVLKLEKIKFRSVVVNHIIELADGSAGQALKLLDQVIDFTDDAKAIEVLKSAGTTDTEVIQICRVLVNTNLNSKTRWIKLSKLLKEFKTDGESSRRAILGYLSAVLLNNGDMGVAMMMLHFEKNFFDSGKAGLVNACYQATFDLED